jgi:hypothetical protein
VEVDVRFRYISIKGDWESSKAEAAFLNKGIYVNFLIAALENICVRPPARQAAWIHQLHAARGASGSITMVVVFLGCLCCC